MFLASSPYPDSCGHRFRFAFSWASFALVALFQRRPDVLYDAGRLIIRLGMKQQNQSEVRGKNASSLVRIYFSDQPGVIVIRRHWYSLFRSTCG
jgi:hypothetical protein